MSDLVVSGTLLDTSRTERRVVDGAAVVANIAHLAIDRIFQSKVQSAPSGKLQFTWFSPRMDGGGGFVYSGPPIAFFRPAHRYLVFLKRTSSGWEVAMPVYARQEELKGEPPRNALRDVSQMTIQQRYKAVAEELEAAALAQPVPRAGMTGLAALVFPSVFDLIGGCAEPFYRHYLSSASPELRKRASDWLELLQLRHLECKQPFEPETLR